MTQDTAKGRHQLARRWKSGDAATRPVSQVRRPQAAIRIGAGALTVAAALGLSLVVAPLPAGAQQPPRVARIGYLSPRAGPSPFDEAFRQGLHDLGYVEGKNIAIEYRWANSFASDRLSELAAGLVGLKLDLIVSTGGNTAALAVKNASNGLPIVFTSGDAVGTGLVASLARPGGNLTGVNLLVIELNSKRLGLLKEAVPRATRVAVLANPANPSYRPLLKDLEQAASSLGVQLQVREVRSAAGFENAFAAMTRERARALLVVSDPMFTSQRKRIVDLAAKARLPAIYEWKEYAEAGGLMSYGPNISEMYRRLATYVDKILKGAKPADLPVEQPTKFDFVVNLKTAKALGLALPRSILIRADQVIQ